jgi:hypothetical protein
VAFVGGTGVQQTNIRTTDPNLTYNTGTGEFAAGGPYTAEVQPFFRNTNQINKNYLITTTYNEMSVGPITINSGTVTINSGARWSIV